MKNKKFNFALVNSIIFLFCNNSTLIYIILIFDNGRGNKFVYLVIRLKKIYKIVLLLTF